MRISSPLRRWFAGAALISAAALVSPASAAAVTVVQSSNWAGYVVHTRTIAAGFSSVSASWTQPVASCKAGRSTHSAVWVGLGGYREGAKALEQIGTEADCSAAGNASYSSWVELLPAAASTLRLAVSPGDAVTASVTVSGRHATLHLRDLTTGRRFSTTRRLSAVDVSSAEWVVEAPSGCSSAGGDCRTLALSDFGTVAFSHATATAAGVTRAASSSAWSATELVLSQDAGAATAGAAVRGPGEVVQATPTALTGESFSVGYSEAAGEAPPEAPVLPGFSGGSGEQQ